MARWLCGKGQCKDTEVGAVGCRGRRGWTWLSMESPGVWSHGGHWGSVRLGLAGLPRDFGLLLQVTPAFTMARAVAAWRLTLPALLRRDSGGGWAWQREISQVRKLVIQL